MRHGVWWLRFLSFALALALFSACAGTHHHWQRSGTNAHDAEHAVEDCEKANADGDAEVDACMREQGFEWEGHPHEGSLRKDDGPALGAIPRLPGY